MFIKKRNPFQTEANSLLKKVEGYTMSSQDRLLNLVKITNELKVNNIPGDFVECGTFKGGSAAVLSRYMPDHRHLWLYDSFEGMPKTSPTDGDEAQKWVGKCVASVEDVQKVMESVGTSSECFTIKKGWFDDTLQEQLPKQVSLLHCDADWYDSVKLVLETFYPLVAEGGCIILDDFGYWEGCREAFYDFCCQHQEKPLLERLSSTQAFWFKGKLSNR